MCVSILFQMLLILVYYFFINIISVEIEGQNDKPPTYTEAVQVQDESDTMLPKYKDIQKDDE